MPIAYSNRQPPGSTSMNAANPAPSPWPAADSAPSMPTAQPRCSAGNSSVMMTIATATLAVMKMRVTIWIAANW